MQYRVGREGQLEFVFPKSREHPRARFKFNMGPHGGSLEFENAGFSYSIGEEARGLPVIFVDKNDKQIASVKCKDAAGGLLENSTLKVFKEAGVFEE